MRVWRVIAAVLRLFCICGGYVRTTSEGRPQCDWCGRRYG